MQRHAQYIRGKIGQFMPKTGLILGSGLGFFADDRMEKTFEIPYDEIPDFPRSTVEGHKGMFVFGAVGDQSVICMQGRFHFYEGYSMREVTLPIRVMAELGVETLVVTNAAGGIDRSFEEGTLMLITDHINMLGTNPLIGPNDDAVGLRFPDMSHAYAPELRTRALAVAKAIGLDLKQGVYLATTGPSFETPAEIRAMACRPQPVALAVEVALGTDTPDRRVGLRHLDHPGEHVGLDFDVVVEQKHVVVAVLEGPAKAGGVPGRAAPVDLEP